MLWIKTEWKLMQWYVYSYEREWYCFPIFFACKQLYSYYMILYDIFNLILENVLKWSTDSDTNLTVVCRHRWGR